MFLEQQKNHKPREFAQFLEDEINKACYGLLGWHKLTPKWPQPKTAAEVGDFQSGSPRGLYTYFQQWNEFIVREIFVLLLSSFKNWSGNFGDGFDDLSLGEQVLLFFLNPFLVKNGTVFSHKAKLNLQVGRWAISTNGTCCKCSIERAVWSWLQTVPVQDRPGLTKVAVHTLTMFHVNTIQE